MLTKKKEIITKIIYYSEVFFAFSVIIAVLIYFFTSLPYFSQLNWENINAFQEFLSSILILVLGLELAKLLITHDIYAIGTLLTYVVARKALKPELTANDLLLIATSFAILFLLNAKFIQKKNV